MRGFDIVIVGAGPGGVQLAVTLAEIKQRTGASFTYVVLEKGAAAGSFFEHFPVHGELISNNKAYTGRDPKSRFSERYDWNSLITADRAVLTRDYSLDFYPPREIVPTMLRDLCARYALPIEANTACRGIERDGAGFIIDTEHGRLRARYVVVATGLKPYLAPIAGIELATAYEHMKPKEHYRDKNVFIVGKGNSAFECAKDIISEAALIMIASPSPVRLAYRTHYVGSVRATNFQLVENYQLKHQAAVLDCEIRSIERSGDRFAVTVAYTHADGEVETLEFDEVIAATGFTGNLDAVGRDIEITKLHGKFPSIDGSFCCSTVDGLYFAGALTHGPDYRTYSSSGFIHGFRYNATVLGTILAERLGVVEQRPEIEANAFVDYLFDDLEEDAGIFLQPGHLGLCYRQAPSGGWIPLGLRTRRWFDDSASEERALLLATLEYGDINGCADPLAITRHPGRARDSIHIHPVLRWRRSGAARELVLEEQLLNRYRGKSGNGARIESFLSAGQTLGAEPLHAM